MARANGLDEAGLARFTPVVVGALVTVVLLQILANFANDYGDFTKGTDTAAGRTDRVLASGQLTVSAMKKGVTLTAIGTLVAGVVTLVLAFVPGAIPGTEGVTLDGARMGLLGAFGVAALWLPCATPWENKLMDTRDLETFTSCFLESLACLAWDFWWHMKCLRPGCCPRCFRDA